MKFKPVGESKEPEIELWLETSVGGAVSLYGREGKGSKCLMVFVDGKFCRSSNAELEGLDTDEKGRIIENE